MAVRGCISLNSISNEEPRLENAPNQLRERGGRLIYKKEGAHLIPCQTEQIAFKLNFSEGKIQKTKQC